MQVWNQVFMHAWSQILLFWVHFKFLSHALHYHYFQTFSSMLVVENHFLLLLPFADK